MTKHPFTNTFLPAVYLFIAALTIGFAEAKEPRQRVIIGGAQSLVPLAVRFTKEFVKSHPGVEVEFRAGGSNYAVNSTLKAEIDIGLITRKLTDKETAGLYVVPLGHDAIILLTHPANTVSDLSLEQLRRIYLGQTTNWHELGGRDKGIVALTRESTSALHATFIDHVFGRHFKGAEKAFILRASKDKILKSIKRIEGSVGYGIVALPEAEAQGVKVLMIERAMPTPENIAQGIYPLTRPQLVISRTEPNSVIREWMTSFAKYVARGAAAQDRP